MALHKKLPRHSAKAFPTPPLKVPSAREAAFALLDSYLVDVASTLSGLLRDLQQQADGSGNAPWAGTLRAKVTLTAPPDCNPALAAQGDQARELRANLLSALSVWVTETLNESKQSLSGPVQVHLFACHGQELHANVYLPLYSSALKPKAVIDPDRALWVAGLQSQKTEWSKSIFTVASAGIVVSLNAVVAKKDALPAVPTPGQAASTAIASPTHQLTLENYANFTALTAAIAFAICVWACFRAFDVSSEYLTWMIQNPTGTAFEEAPQEVALRNLRQRQKLSLLLGVALLVGAALLRALI